MKVFSAIQLLRTTMYIFSYEGYEMNYLLANLERTLALYVKRRGLLKKCVHLILKLQRLQSLTMIQ